MKKEIFVDGFLTNSNPSNSGGFTICENGICKRYEIEQLNLTNNQVEVMSCIFGMLCKNKTIISDSQLAVNCLNNLWTIKAPALIPLVSFGKLLLKEKKKILKWKPREKNLAGLFNEKLNI